MRTCRPIIASALAAGWLVSIGGFLHATQFESSVDDDWFRAWPPASVIDSFPSTIHQGNARLGDIDTLEFHAT